MGEGRKKSSAFKRFRQGRWLSLSTYTRNAIAVVIIMSLFFIYITFKFSVQMKLDEIISLREELSNAHTEMIKVSAEYNNRIRESELIELLDSLHLGLKEVEQPPYYLDEENGEREE